MNESRLQELCEAAGIGWDVPPATQPLRTKEWRQIAHGVDGASKNRVYQMAAKTEVDEEKGQPGTPFGRTGQVTPAVAKYGSRAVRGTHGKWGLYEEHFRSEPQLYDPITTIGEALHSAHYEVQPPDVVNAEQREALEAFVDWSNAWLHSIEGGIREFARRSGETLLIYGVSIHEVVWGLDDEDRKHPVKFGEREPSTYDEYILTESQDGLEAVKFEPDEGEAYILENGSDLKPESPTAAPTKKMIHAAYHQRGNNFDGIPPLRPAIIFKKLKQLLLQIAGLTADKYGVPIPKVMDAPVEVGDDFAPPQGTADDDDKEELYRNVKRMRAGKAPVAKIPSGLDLQYESPQGTPPTFKELLEYCDQQMAQGLKNEGSLLAQSAAVGSYALGEVKDDQFLRKAPAVAQMVLEPVNKIIRLTAQAFLEPQLESPLPAYPRCQMRLGAGVDAEKWLGSLDTAMQAGLLRMPEGLQQAVLDKLDLPEDVLEEQEAPTDVAGTGEAEDGGEPDGGALS